MQPNITFDDLYLPDSDLLPIRHELYHSTGAGFYIFRNFLTDDQVLHMRSFWSTLETNDWHKQYEGPHRMFMGCPNYYLHEEGIGQLSYFNFLWNHPADEFTHSLAYNIHFLRNRIEARNDFREIFPLHGRSVSYRVIFSRNIKQIVPPHRDWVGESFDPRRLQATLFLSEKGKDYEGVGFGIETNYGKSVVLGEDVEIKPGDLVLWRHGNIHFAKDIMSDGAIGFMRMIMPPEAMFERPNILDLIKTKTIKSIKRIPLVESYALPIYRKMKQR